jgi:hypothetical protein
MATDLDVPLRSSIVTLLAVFVTNRKRTVMFCFVKPRAVGIIARFIVGSTVHGMWCLIVPVVEEEWEMPTNGYHTAATVPSTETFEQIRSFCVS